MTRTREHFKLLFQIFLSNTYHLIRGCKSTPFCYNKINRFKRLIDTLFYIILCIAKQEKSNIKEINITEHSFNFLSCLIKLLYSL